MPLLEVMVTRSTWSPLGEEDHESETANVSCDHWRGGAKVPQQEVAVAHRPSGCSGVRIEVSLREE